jgi:hypothetical protein
MSLKETITRTTVANITSAILVIAGIAYFIYTKNTDGVMFLAGSGVGYLFGKGVAK